LEKSYDEEFYIGFEFLTTVTIKDTTFWDVTQWSLVAVHWHFGGTSLFLLQSQWIRQARNWQSFSPASCWFLAWFVFLTLKMEAVSSSEMLLWLLPDYTALHPSRQYSSRALQFVHFTKYYYADQIGGWAGWGI
jgi:hypothetical protein